MKAVTLCRDWCIARREALLNEAGAERNVRIFVLDRENALRGQKKQRGFLMVSLWRDPEEPGTVVDAAVTHRLRENKALGKSSTEGETPRS